MDLPISRIARTKVISEANGNIRLYDPAYDNDLLTLTDNVKKGQYVVCVTYQMADRTTVSKLMSVQSQCDFETLSRQSLLRELAARLQLEDYYVHHIGLYHSKGANEYVGKNPVTTCVDEDSYETLYVDLKLAA